jgi:phosphatidate cytidylyltransferase
MSNLVVRALSGAVFVALMLGAIYFGQITTMILVTLLAGIGLFEYVQMVSRIEHISIAPILFIATGLVLFILPLYSGYFLFFINVFILPVCVVIIVLYIIDFLFAKDKGFYGLVAAIFGYLYILIPFFIVVLIRDFSEENGWKYLFSMFVIIWTNDTFAYLTGRTFGKTKLFERISPKKTWEGTIGGLLFSLIAGVSIAYTLDESFVKWSILALFIALAAIFGDLFESLLKRTAGIKDSGNIMPGHGGVLDRFDAVLFAAPVFWVLWPLLSEFFG